VQWQNIHSVTQSSNNCTQSGSHDGRMSEVFSRMFDRCILVTLTVTASGLKLPVFFIAKGKTMKCTEKLNVSSPHVVRPTESGWCRYEILPDYIENIILPYTGDASCCLILDCYGAHKKYVSELYHPQYNIEFAWVPECMTATLSPLDVLINPVVKSIGQGEFRKMSVERIFDGNPIESGAESWRLATKTAIESFNKIKTTTVRKSFEKAIGLDVDLCRKAKEDREKERKKKEEEAREVMAAIDAILRDFV